MIVVTEALDLTEENRLIAYTTNVIPIQVVNEAGDPVDLSAYDECRAVFRADETEDTLPSSAPGDIVYSATWSATDITPETHTRFTNKALGAIEIVVGAVETKVEQDGSARQGGLYDVLCYTTATGASNSLQIKVARGVWTTEWTSAKITP